MTKRNKAIFTRLVYFEKGIYDASKKTAFLFSQTYVTRLTGYRSFVI